MFFFLPSACSKRDPQQLLLGDAPKFGRQKLIRYSENRCVFLSGTPIWGAVVHLGVVISWSCPVINIRCFFLFAGHRKRIAHNLDLPPVARITRNPILQVGDPVLNFHLPWLHPGGEIQGMMSCWVTWPFLLGLIRHLIKGNQWFSSALIIIRPAISRGVGWQAMLVFCWHYLGWVHEVDMFFFFWSVHQSKTIIAFYHSMSIQFQQELLKHG